MPTTPTKLVIDVSLPFDSEEREKVVELSSSEKAQKILDEQAEAARVTPQARKAAIVSEIENATSVDDIKAALLNWLG